MTTTMSEGLGPRPQGELTGFAQNYKKVMQYAHNGFIEHSK